MAYIPQRCEKFTPDAHAGWICCDCGHFNSIKKTVCYNCQHDRCEKMLAEIRPDRKKDSGPFASLNLPQEI